MSKQLDVAPLRSKKGLQLLADASLQLETVRRSRFALGLGQWVFFSRCVPIHATREPSQCRSRLRQVRSQVLHQCTKSLCP